jgi:HSP20 family protein
MNINAYDPWQVLDEVQRQFLAGNPRQGSTDSSVNWAPAVDIREHTDRWVLEADLPGVSIEDIEILLDEGVLTIRGERKIAADEAASYKRRERERGTFVRRFQLPDAVNAEGISARSQRGVLTVTIPKQPAVQPRRIEVQH